MPERPSARTVAAPGGAGFVGSHVVDVARTHAWFVDQDAALAASTPED